MMFSAAKLTEARKIAGYSQRDLASRIGVTYQLLQKWEYGKFSPSGDNLKALAAALGKPTEFFFEQPDPLNFRQVGESVGRSIDGVTIGEPLPRVASLPPSKVKHLRAADQRLRQALINLAEALQEVAQLADNRKAIQAIARVQTQVAEAQQELDQI